MTVSCVCEDTLLLLSDSKDVWPRQNLKSRLQWNTPRFLTCASCVPFRWMWAPPKESWTSLTEAKETESPPSQWTLCCHCSYTRFLWLKTLKRKQRLSALVCWMSNAWLQQWDCGSIPHHPLLGKPEEGLLLVRPTFHWSLTKPRNGNKVTQHQVIRSYSNRHRRLSRPEHCPNVPMYLPSCGSPHWHSWLRVSVHC